MRHGGPRKKYGGLQAAVVEAILADRRRWRNQSKEGTEETIGFPAFGTLSGPSRRRAPPSYASALTAAARRLLWRAALFLWMMFLSAIESIVLAAR
jgi:hypothetical protein